MSDRAHIVFNFHQICDGLNELNSGDLKIGTTKRGIGPTYASKMERYGVRMGALRNWDRFKEQYMRIYNIVRGVGEVIPSTASATTCRTTTMRASCRRSIRCCRSCFR